MSLDLLRDARAALEDVAAQRGLKLGSEYDDALECWKVRFYEVQPNETVLTVGDTR